MPRLPILVVSVFSATFTFAQGWQFEIEGGVNSSGFPKSDRYAGGKERIVPQISPVLGLHIRRSSASGLYFLLGTRYARVGVKTLFHKSGTNALTGAAYTFDIDESTRFSRLSVGGAIGYQRLIWKKYFYVQAGYRQCYFTGGSYQYHAYSQNDDGTRSDLFKKYDPLTDPSLDQRASKIGWEAFAGIGVNLNKHWSIGVQYALTPQMQFVEPQPGPIDTPNSLHHFHQNDLCLSGTYRFNTF